MVFAPDTFSLDLNCSPEQIASAAGALWVTCYYLNELERISTAGSVNRIPIPSQTTANGVTAGPDDAAWFTEISASQLGRVLVKPVGASTS